MIQTGGMGLDLHEIEVFIDKNGEVVIQVRGVKGKQCLDLTAPLEELLGNQVKERELTYEAYEETGQSEEQLQQKLRET